MTNMKRISVSLPDSMVHALDEMKRNDQKARPYSELIRWLIGLGLEKAAKNARTQ